MAEDAFAFFRATFYRWSVLYTEHCPELADAPQVLAVGDLHAENFGTWRDAEGRLAWGINDFDEAVQQPYPQDLVRLATSVLLARRESRLAISPARACRALLQGYRDALDCGGAPVVLAEHHRWLRELAVRRLKDGRAFWDRLQALPTVRSGITPQVRALLGRALPEPALPFRLVHRESGLGSLGRQRLAALATWRGGAVAREAKPLAPSAWLWALRLPLRAARYRELLHSSLRTPDPFLAIRAGWLIRRLAPDCSRIELAGLPRRRDEDKLLRMMGWETANVHLGTRGAQPGVLHDLARRGERWLPAAAQRMLEQVLADFRDWRRSTHPSGRSRAPH